MALLLEKSGYPKRRDVEISGVKERARGGAYFEGLMADGALHILDLLFSHVF